METSVSSSLTVISAGLTLLESVNTPSTVPTAPKLDVLLTHPTMATKGGMHSPPPRRKVLKGAKPTFQQLLKDAEVEIGGRGKFTAIVKGDPQPLVTWLADGTPIRSGGTYRYVKDGERHILLVPRVQRHHESTITCKAVNQHGETSSSAKLIVMEKHDVITIAADVTTEEARHDSRSSDVELTITSVDGVTSEIDDVMDTGDVIDTTVTSVIEGKRTEMSTMDFEETTIDTSDVTDATLTSSIEEKRTEMSAMDFEETAINLLNEVSYQEQPNNFAQDSVIEGYFPPLESFSLETDQLSPSKRSAKFVHFSEESLLQEYPIGGSDSSEVCSETSSVMSFKHVIVGKDFDWTEEVRRLIREEIDYRERLKRLEEYKKAADEIQSTEDNIFAENEEVYPPKFTKPICDCFITAGETAHFVYILDSSQPTAITWQRNGVDVTRNTLTPNIGIIDDNEAGCLLISDANKRHSGVYTCTAENIHGSTKCTAKLIVTPNLSKTSRSTSTFGEMAVGFEAKTEFRDQTSQTVIYTKNKGVNFESMTEPPREINDNETGEGGRLTRPPEA